MEGGRVRRENGEWYKGKREREEKPTGQKVTIYLQDELGVHQALADDNMALKKKVASLERMLDELQYQNDKLKKQNSQRRDGWIQAEKRAKEVNLELEDAKMDVSSLRARCRR